MRIITTSAGPLCISHTDAWASTPQHADSGSYIRLYPRAEPMKAFAVVHAIADKVEVGRYLHDVSVAMQTEPGVESLRVDYVPGASDGRIFYEMDDSGGKEQRASGFVSIKKHEGKLTRFDFVAESDFYNKNYKEMLIMSDSIQLVE